MGLKKHLENIYFYSMLAALVLLPWLVPQYKKPSRPAVTSPDNQAPPPDTGPDTAAGGGPGPRPGGAAPADSSPWWDLLVLLALMAAFLTVLLLVPVGRTPDEDGRRRPRPARGLVARRGHGPSARARGRCK